MKAHLDKLDERDMKARLAVIDFMGSVNGIEDEELKLRYNGRLGRLIFVLFYESYYFVYLS